MSSAGAGVQARKDAGSLQLVRQSDLQARVACQPTIQATGRPLRRLHAPPRRQAALSLTGKDGKRVDVHDITLKDTLFAFAIGRDGH